MGDDKDRDAPSSARDFVFGNIRSAIKGRASEQDRKQRVARRLSEPPQHVIPARATLARTALLEQLKVSLVGEGADILDIAEPSSIPVQIDRYLSAHQLPLSLRFGDDDYLSALPWQDQPSLRLQKGATSGDDLVTLSRAVGAAAETGSLFLVSGADNPTSLNFLSDTHIVVLEAAKILGSYEEIWGVLRATHGDGGLPRAVNIIGGPSRTADIEQTIVKGAHGPRRLLVLIVN